jgi:hypothetical protein
MNGFADERKNTGTSIVPRFSSTAPESSHAQAATACVDSTRSPRVTSTIGIPASSLNGYPAFGV